MIKGLLVYEQTASGDCGRLREEVLGVHRSLGGSQTSKDASGNSLFAFSVCDNAPTKRVSFRDQKETCHASS